MFNFSANHLAAQARPGSMTSPKPSSPRPSVAYCVAGKVNSADRLYLVIESVRPGTKRRRASITRFLPMAQEVPQCADPGVESSALSPTGVTGRQRLRLPQRANRRQPPVKTGEIAALLNRCQHHARVGTHTVHSRRHRLPGRAWSTRTALYHPLAADRGTRSAQAEPAIVLPIQSTDQQADTLPSVPFSAIS